MLIVVIGPPVYVLGEAFFGWLLSSDHGRAVSKNRFSILRIVVALAGALLVLLVVGIIITYYGESRPLRRLTFAVHLIRARAAAT